MEKLEPDPQLVSHAAVAFNEIVAPLERKGGRLGGSGRSDCLRAFEENEEGFAVCARLALTRARLKGYANPLGLLVKMCRDGQHRIPQSRANVCASCEVGGGLHSADCPEAIEAGTDCDEHEDAA